jgi:hypothetical protein
VEARLLAQDPTLLPRPGTDIPSRPTMLSRPLSTLPRAAGGQRRNPGRRTLDEAAMIALLNT